MPSIKPERQLSFKTMLYTTGQLNAMRLIAATMILCWAAMPAAAQYAGSQACERYHKQIYQRWQRTRMANVVQDPKARRRSFSWKRSASGPACRRGGWRGELARGVESLRGPRRPESAERRRAPAGIFVVDTVAVAMAECASTRRAKPVRPV